MPCSCFGSPRRMPGVPGCRAGRADASGERGAGTAAAYQPPSQHLWGPDYGVDGERGYDFCEVCTNSLDHPAAPWRTLRCSRSRWVSSFSTSFRLRMLQTPPHRGAHKADGQMTSPGSSHRGAQFSSLRMASLMSELLNVCLRVS